MAKSTNYTWEEREKILRRTLPPENMKISELAREIGVTKTTLYAWKNKLKLKGLQLSSSRTVPKNWSSEDKFHIVIETYSLNQIDLAAYCRQKGLYIEQVEKWKKQCLHANTSHTKDANKLENDLKEEKKRSKQLERELTRKEKALAEAAALLVLQKKTEALWKDQEEN